MRFWYLGFLVLGACAQLEVTMPNPRVETPETRGGNNRWKFGVAGGDAHVFRATDNGGERPPVLDDPEIRGYFNANPSVSISPAAPIELGAEVSALSPTIGLMAKWQFLGAHTADAKPGSIPVALFARVGSAYGKKEGDQSSTFGAGGYEWQGTVVGRYAQLGISGGYRASERILLYTGLTFAKYDTVTKISQDATAADPVGGSYERNQKGDGQTLAAGVMWTWPNIQFFVSGAYSHIDYGPADDIDDPFVHTGVQFTPGGGTPRAD